MARRWSFSYSPSFGDENAKSLLGGDAGARRSIAVTGVSRHWPAATHNPRSSHQHRKQFCFVVLCLLLPAAAAQRHFSNICHSWSRLGPNVLYFSFRCSHRCAADCFAPLSTFLKTIVKLSFGLFACVRQGDTSHERNICRDFSFKCVLWTLCLWSWNKI